MQKASPKQIDANTIQINITAEIHKELYEKFENKIINILRQKFQNKKLNFKFNLIKSDVESKRPLNQTEKYNELLKQNPVLNTLRDKFNLDIKK